MIHIIGQEPKFKWAGTPFAKRYSERVFRNSDLLAAITRYDSQLDLKFYMPTERWHLVRYLSSDRNGKFTRVWDLDNRPDLGLRAEPGFWIIDGLKAGDLRGGATDRIEEMDKHNAAIDASNDREMEAQCRDFAIEMRKPLIKLQEDGPNSEYKGVF